MVVSFENIEIPEKDFQIFEETWKKTGLQLLR